MESDNVFELLSGEDGIIAQTSYTLAEIWEKRNFLSGSADYQKATDRILPVYRKDRYVGEVIENVGVDSPAVEVRPPVMKIGNLEMPRGFFTQVTSGHDYEDLLKRYRAAVGPQTNGVPQSAIQVLQEWALSGYDTVANMQVAACEKGLCQALSNENGWNIPAKRNQEPFKYDPQIDNSTTGLIADFDANDPSMMLLKDLVLKMQTKGYSPDTILVGDNVAMAIMNSQYYKDNNNRVVPITQSFNYTPALSSNMVRAMGALELTGITVAGCKIIWINSQYNGVPSFDPDCAIALKFTDFATIYSAPIFSNMTLLDDIINLTEEPRRSSKEIRYMYEFYYLPVVNYPGEIFRIYYR